MKINNLFTFLLILCSVLSLTEAFCRCKEKVITTIPIVKNVSDTVVEVNREENNNYYLTSKDCNYRPQKIAKIINPYQSSIIDQAPRKPFGSVCLKCAACLAVTEQLEHRLQELKGIYPSDYENFHDHGGPENLRSLCNKGFRNFDLRTFEGKSFIGEISPESVHVQTPMDGLWTKKLRDLCNIYLDHIDETSLFSIYSEQNNVNITEFICKGKGIFRDCENVDYSSEEIPMSDLEMEGARTKMCVNCLKP